MELQLGLSLSWPTTTTRFSKGFDLNNQIMDNSSSDRHSIITSSDTCLEMGINVTKNKRSFDRAFDHHENHVDCTTSSSSVNPVKRRTTLPLVSWNDQPNEDDDQEEENTHVNHLPSNTQVEEEVNSIVGWPPVKSWRRKFHHHYQNQHPPQFQHHQEIADGTLDNNDHVDAANGDGATNSMYVKVTMDGMGIGRKINLRLHQSYQTLTTTLINMFGKYENNGLQGLDEVERQPYTLTYQDGEGDWLLVGDVPWKTFIQSVKRLKILKESSS
ncbi:hypothetical protein C5167_023782 [Papaver somniferum]|uniref:Auxin-responsive protein n=1 Tax=Papaver somniferum TaxID=3469 RepID=A0A4Y7JQK3_PAPSO|nr:auxin-responsive protein IAA29-like [Papaver somniferum]RZC62019.1 hypothetical protein C5167_023782 [Papaver somniferum]